MAVVQCKVCMALTTQMWDHLVNWTVRTGSTATDDDVAGLGAMLCETEVPVEVLRDWVILHAEVHQVHHSSTGKRIPSKLGAEEFFLLSQRSRQHATEREIEATRSACRALFVDADGEATSGFAQAVAKMQGKYLAKMKEVVGAVDASGLSEEEARLAPERSCMDKHPQCKYWEERVSGLFEYLIPVFALFH